MAFEPFLYLILFAYGIVLLVAPFWLISLSVREARLRRDLKNLADENTKERLKLQRAIGELQSKLASATTPASVGAPQEAKPEAPHSVPVPRSFPVVSIPAAPVPPPAKTTPPAHPDFQAPTKPQPPTVPLAPPTPPVPVQPKPAAPITPQSPSAAQPPAPSVPKPEQPSSVPPKIVTPPTIPHPPIAPPHAAPPSVPHPSALPAAAARISAAPPSSPLRVPASKPTLQERMKAVSSIEEKLGASWFAILGVIMLVIGVALLGKLALQYLGPGGKCFILYAVALSLLAGGISLEKRERYVTLGRVAIGGGWGLLFFSTFGLYHVNAMHVLDSLVLDSVLMLLVAVAMAAHTLRYKSQFVTGVAFLLAYSTVALSQDTVYSLIAGVMLAIGLVGIVLKMGWYELEVFGILASYLNHLYWLYGFLGLGGAHGRDFPQYHASLALLFFYWLIFRISYVARGIKSDFEERVSTVSAVLNTLLLLGLLKFQSVHPELAYLALFAIGAFELAFALLPATRQRRRAFVLLSIIGSALILAAVPAHYAGQANYVTLLWTIGAEVFLAAGIIFGEVVFRRIGLFTGMLVGFELVVFNLPPLIQLRSKLETLDLTSGILFALCAVVFYLNALFVRSRWEESFDAGLDRGLLTIQSYLGAFSAAAAAWALFANDWTAVAFAVIMVVLAAGNRRLESRHLQVQFALLGMLTLYRALVFNLHIESPSHVHITTRLMTLPLLGALFYATAKLATLRDDQTQRVFRALFSFGGAFMFGFLIWYEAPETWIASLFLAFGILLAFAARRWDVLHLSLQEHVFAALAVIQTLNYNCYVPGHYGPFSIRLITVSLVAAGLYAISRRATNASASHSLIAAYLHTTAATFLLALLMWYEVAAGSGWLAALWALFALVLTAIDRRWQLNDLRCQAHALAAITLIRCIGINLHDQELWHGISVRLLTLSLVAVVFYAMSLIIRMPAEWRERDFHHVYSWTASFLVSLLLWYELDPLARAVGWAVFGLILFEYGFLRKIAQYRYQAYVAFAASFVRIFFANLTAGLRGDLFGPRMYTVLPLIAIFFFVYAQLSEKEDGAIREKRFRSDALVAYLGTATLVALFYFQFDPEWVVNAYALIALALFAAAWALKREIFLHQGILVTLAAFARGMAHNLFGSSNFTNGTWTGRYFVVSMAIAVLFATLFFAFPLRAGFNASPDAKRRGKIASALIGRPEQLQFFVPVILLTVMLALKTDEGILTVSWGVEAMLIVCFAFLVRESNFLDGGFALLVVCAGKVFAMDYWRFDLAHKVVTFIGVGLATIAASFVYVRFKEKLRHVP